MAEVLIVRRKPAHKNRVRLASFMSMKMENGKGGVLTCEMGLDIEPYGLDTDSDSSEITTRSYASSTLRSFGVFGS